jgi:hypothetical protein
VKRIVNVKWSSDRIGIVGARLALVPMRNVKRFVNIRWSTDRWAVVFSASGASRKQRERNTHRQNQHAPIIGNADNRREAARTGTRASRPPLCIRKPDEFGRNAKTCWRT